MVPSTMADDLHSNFGEAFFEFSERGVYYRRSHPPRSHRALESRLLDEGPVRVMDFNDGSALLPYNVVDRDGAEPAEYEGVVASTGHRIFRVDHHYSLRDLSDTTTTCLTLRWLRGLHRRRRTDVLEAVARSRYIANHADTDILLANYLASMACDERTVHSHFADWCGAASLRNDYIRLDGFGSEAQKIFYACLGVERDVLAEDITFAEAQCRYLPHLAPWLSDEPVAPEVASRLDRWVREMRDEEDKTLHAIALCEQRGGLRWELDDRLVVCEMDRKIDNADLYLYLSRRAKKPLIQALIFPDEGGAKVKLRAHDGFDLNPLFPKLNERMPGAGFGGRASAGGSKTFDVDPATLVAAIGWSIDTDP